MRTTLRSLVLVVLSSSHHTASALVVPSTRLHSLIRVYAKHRFVQPACIATSDEDKALLEASKCILIDLGKSLLSDPCLLCGRTKKVTMVAKNFGVSQGKAAQAWVERAVKGGDASCASLMEMQLSLFEECKVDDTSGRCKELTAAIDALTLAVDERKRERSEGTPFTVTFGATPIQEAATKLRETASLFGPEQKQSADGWIKRVTSGNDGSAEAMLEEQIVLFGECVLSDGGTPSNCQQLEAALAELQAAIDACGISTTNVSASRDPEVVASELKGEAAAEATVVAAAASEDAVATKAATANAITPAPASAASAPVTGRKRKAIKKFFGRFLFWKRSPDFSADLSALAVASFLAAPEEADPALKGASIDEAVAALEAEGVSDALITMARTSILPYLADQDAPGGPSTSES